MCSIYRYLDDFFMYGILFLFFREAIQCTLDYPCMDCPVCILPIQEEKLLVANYKGGNNVIY